MRDPNRAIGRVSSNSAPLHLFTISENIFLETEAEKYLLEPHRYSKSQTSRPDLGLGNVTAGSFTQPSSYTGSPGCSRSDHRGQRKEAVLWREGQAIGLIRQRSTICVVGFECTFVERVCYLVSALDLVIWLRWMLCCAPVLWLPSFSHRKWVTSILIERLGHKIFEYVITKDFILMLMQGLLFLWSS